MGWYDNEWGFSNRMSDTAALFGSAVSHGGSARSTAWRSPGKRVLLRADLNVPVRDGKITDLTRHRAAVRRPSANWPARAPR